MRRAKSDAFVDAHPYSGPRVKPDSDLDSRKIADHDEEGGFQIEGASDAPLMGGNEMANTCKIDEGECVTISGAADNSFNGTYFRSHTEDRKFWERDENTLHCFRHVSSDSKVTYLWRQHGGCWACATECNFHDRGNVFLCKEEIRSPEDTHVHPALVPTWCTKEWMWEPEAQAPVPMFVLNNSIKVTAVPV